MNEKIHAKYITNLNKKFKFVDIDKRLSIFEQSNINMLDSTFIMLVEAKNKESDCILANYIDKDEYQRRNVNIEFDIYEKGKVKIAKSYLKWAIDFLQDEYIVIQSGKDLPIVLEDENFKIIIANRLNND